MPRPEDRDASGLGAVSAGAVRAQLERIEASPSFSGAWRQKKLLEYLVGEWLAGRVENLKEYSVGVEVFEKGDDFDPRMNPIVRVEASRLRKRLEEYYSAPGAGSEVRIELPRGSYVPRITEGGQAAPPSLAKGRMTALRRQWPAAALGLAALAAGAWWLTHRPKDGGAAGGYSFSRVTQDLARTSSPSVTPDGKILVYTRRERGEESDIYARRLETGETWNLTPDSKENDHQAAVSPDGASVVFRSERSGGGIFLVAIAGGPARRLANFGFHPEWSPDGKQVVFSSGTFHTPEDGPRRRGGVLYEVDVASGLQRQLTTPETVYDAVQPSWSPDGRRIAFWGSDANGNRDIWTVAARPKSLEEARPTPVTQDLWIDWNPVWSADGRWLYFVSDRDGAMNLWRVAVDTETGRVKGTLEPIRTPSSYSADLALTRDGRRIFYANRQISSVLYGAGLDVTGAQVIEPPAALTGEGERFREPQMSPDGAWLAVRIQDPQEDIGLIRPDGKTVKRLTNDHYKDRSPKWSPDGQYLYFLSNRGGTFEHWAIRPDGTGLRRLSGGLPLGWWVDGTLTAFPPGANPQAVEPAGRSLAPLDRPQDFIPECWSPDKSRVVGRLRSATEGPGVLMVYSRADKSQWALGPLAGSPAWLPDGRHLIYQVSGELLVGDVATRQSRPLGGMPSRTVSDVFTLSRDGRRLYFVQGKTSESIWVAEAGR